MTRVDRRAFLVVGGVLLTGCAADRVPAADTSTAPTPTGRPRRPRRSRAPSPAPTVGAPPALPAPAPWAPTAAEVEPRAKLAATRVIEALGTVPEGGDLGSAGAAQRLADSGADPALAAQAGSLVPPVAPAVATLVYPQYGGLTDRTASVMAVVEQTWLADPGDPGDPGGLARRTVTVDVRLARTAGGWVVTELRPVAVPDPGTVPAPTGAVAALLAQPRVQLPDAARVDLAQGRVDPAVVETLTRLVGEFLLSVSVFSAGHPVNVFGTTGPSNHGRGRAVDIWAVDGRPVIELATDSSLLQRFLLAAAAGGSDEIGGPVVPPGAGAGYFTNALHRDHVHVGFDA